jgi:TRAP transporter T-component
VRAKKIFLLPILIFICLQSWSCGIFQTIAVKSTTVILDNGMVAIFEEPDLQLADQAIASDLKLLEALHKSDPDDDHVLLLLTEGYTGYALGFAEDENPERAKMFYRRARNYGLDVLRKNKNFDEAFSADPETFKQSVETFSDDDVPIIFWTANAWGNLINLSIDQPDVLADLYKVNALMDFVLRHNEKYYFGSVHLYFGTILATTPKMLGGDPAKAKEQFERCIEIGGGKFLLPYVYYAKTYAVEMQNKELFESLLKTVDTTSVDVLPEQRLVNAIAKKKAKALLLKEPDLF